MKELLTPKNIFYAVLVIIVAIFAVKGLKYIDGLKTDKDRLFTELVGQKEAYQQLSAKAAKLEIDYKAQGDLRAEAEKRFANEKSALQSQIKVLADATFLIKEKARESGNSDVVFNGENSQYVLNEIRFNDGPAVGYVLIFKDGRMVSKMYNHQIKVNTVVSKDETSGRYSVITKADYILKSPSLNSGAKNWLNQPYALDIVGGTALIDPTEPIIYQKHFQWWNPKLNLNANLEPKAIHPGLGVSIMGYGRTRSDLDFKFLQLGLEADEQSLAATLTPVMWRPFDSFISNTYIGPGASYGKSGLGYFLGIQVGL